MLIKALRPQSGSYGSVDTGGVIDIDSDQAAALKATGNWSDASSADLDAARGRQERFVADAASMPVGPQWAATGGTLADPLKPAAVQAADANAAYMEERAATAAADAAAAKKTAARVSARAEVQAAREAELDAGLPLTPAVEADATVLPPPAPADLADPAVVDTPAGSTAVDTNGRKQR